MKNTSVTPSSTLDMIPSPNHTAKIGARITRGIEFTAMMYGSSRREANGVNASHSPMTSPLAVPIAKASSVSSKVMPRCKKILPETNQSASRRSTMSGSPKKNGDSTSKRVNRYQAVNTAPSSARCQGHIARWGALASSLLSIGAGVSHHDFLLEGLPDPRMQLDETRIEADLGDVARTRQIDRELADRTRARAR